MKINRPTQLTFLRLALIPVFILLVVQPHYLWRVAALLIFIGASLTDFYDGKLARSRGEVTVVGTFLDPLADKLLISSAFIIFVQVREFHIPAWMVVLIIGREFLITGLRTLAAAEGRILAAMPAGKFKTTSQLVAIITSLVILVVHGFISRYGWGAVHWWGHHVRLWHFVSWILINLPYWLTFVVTFLTIVSGFIYLYSNRDLFHEKSSR